MTALLDPAQIEERDRRRQKQLEHQVLHCKVLFFALFMANRYLSKWKLKIHYKITALALSNPLINLIPTPTGIILGLYS